MRKERIARLREAAEKMLVHGIDTSFVMDVITVPAFLLLGVQTAAGAGQAWFIASYREQISG
jgi:hypothetical protein